MRSYVPLFCCAAAIVVASASCGSNGGKTSTGATGEPSGSTSSGAATGGASGSGHGGSTASTASGETGGSTGTLMLMDGGPCSAFMSCADRKFDCGMVGDGCGNILNCGTSCSASDTCTNNVCTPTACTKTTCAKNGSTCGTIPDGCGGTLDCGTCSTGDACVGTPGSCQPGTCTPITCASQNWTCGMQSDGCGDLLSCGTCPTDYDCNNGTCQPSTVMCTPMTCAQQGFNCGSATDGCGNVIDCSGGATCPVGDVCGGGGMANVCGSSCSAAAQLVYVWALDGTIYSFDPPSKTFTMVAVPDCGDASNPNSMAIDRNLVAWLNYLSPDDNSPNDYIYKFDLNTKTGCQPSGINIPSGF